MALFARRVVVLLALALGALVPIASEPAGGTAAVAWKQVSAGGDHACGITTEGRLYCWGSNSDGQLGIGSGFPSPVPAPFQVVGGFTDWTRVSAGGLHTCALRSNGAAYCWGNDSDGQLGDGGANQDKNAPVQAGANAYTSIAAGGAHTCAVVVGGQAHCWGDDFWGQIGNGGSVPQDVSVPNGVAGSTDYTAVTSGTNHSCGRKENGRLFCWGADSSGQLGNGGGLIGMSVPVQVAGNKSNWAQVDAGGFHTCARRTNGRLFCWGHDGDGQLGNGGTTTTPQGAPVQVSGNKKNWATVSGGSGGGSWQTCARKTNGRLFCWGSDSLGQVGDGGGPGSDVPAPVQVAGNKKNWAKISAGGDHTCASRKNRKLFCWGRDVLGELGDGPPNGNQSAPVKVDDP